MVFPAGPPTPASTFVGTFFENCVKQIVLIGAVKAIA
jgi:hypothetical protein